LKPLDDQSLARNRAVCCEVAADAVLRLRMECLPEFRRNLGPSHGEPLPPSFLKHADEQTVAGLGAVFQAIDKSRLHSTCFRDWGVVAAPRFLGRPAMAAALQRFAAEGAWGVSPHLIPHRSLHSMSGTVSQALKIYGPNFGVGGGPSGPLEALLTAMALLERKRLPGVWVVLTCLDPELPPDASGQPVPGTQAIGLALALTRSKKHDDRIRLHFVHDSSAKSHLASVHGSRSELLRLETLMNVLHDSRGAKTTLIQLLEGGQRIELSRNNGVEPIEPSEWLPRSDREEVEVANAPLRSRRGCVR
jgi:hypothetical protein